MQFFVVMLVIFILGFFLDFIEIAVVVVPIVAPILLSDPAANVTAVWLGVMVGLNIQTSFLTPPFGFALFYLRGVADKVVKTLSIYKGVVPFIGLQVLALIITGIFPALVNYLPNRTYLTSESAPPPMNPRIQPCLEAEVLQYYRANQQMLQSAITAMSEADVTYLPDAVQTQLHTSLEQAGSVFTMVDGIYTATANRMEYVPDYAPLHREARGIEAEIRAAESELKELKVQIRRLDDTPEDLLRKQSMSDQETELQALITDLQATIPAGWESARVEYVSLNKAEIKARRDYRRAVDESYQTIVDLQMVIGEADAVAAALPDVQALAAVIAEQPAKPAMAAIKQQERQLGALSGVSKAKSKLSKARRALKGSKYNPQKARQYLDEAIAMLQNQVVWRQRAAVELMPALVTYDQAIAGSIGLRLQERMPLELAKSVSACMSNHKDISLNF